MRIHIEIGNDTLMEGCKPHIEETDDILWRASESFNIDGHASIVGIILNDCKKGFIRSFNIEYCDYQPGSRTGQFFFQLMERVKGYEINLDDISCIIGLCGSDTCETLIVINNMD